MENENLVHCTLQPVEPWADTKPLYKRYASKRSKGAKARNKRRYYELLAKDLMDPASATKRTARHFILIREATEDTRQEYKCFCPYLEGTTETSLRGGPECGPQGQGQYTHIKGKGKAAWQRTQYNLLQVLSARPRPPSPPPAQCDHWSWQGVGGG